MAIKIKSKKSQVWLSDYTLSMLLFVFAALIAVKIIINSFSATTDFQDLKSESAKISDILLSEGYATDGTINWTNATVIRPGLLTGKRLDESKVVKAMDNNYINYTSMKLILQTKHDFAVIFEEPDGDLIKFNAWCVVGNNVSVLADCSNTSFSFHYHNLVKIDRFVVYNSSIKKMVVYAWN